MHLHLPAHPTLAREVFAADAARLDAWLAECPGPTPDASDFLYGLAPVRLFDGLLAGAPSRPGDVWIAHVSGYFGGVWLRDAIRRAQPENALLAAGAAPSDEGLTAVADRAEAALAAAEAEPEALRAYLAAELPGLVAGFGYNQGYLLQILDAPPAGCEAPTAFIEPVGPLACRYAAPRLEAPQRLEPVAVRLAGGGGGWAALAADVRTGQEAAEKQGRAVWSTGLSVEGLTPVDYARLLDLSSSFLEVTQAAALCAAQSLAEDLAEGDAESGRRAARANACLQVWTGSYGLGLMDPRPDGDAEAWLPRVEA